MTLQLVTFIYDFFVCIVPDRIKSNQIKSNQIVICFTVTYTVFLLVHR